MSGAYAAFENMVVMIYIFGAHVPLFLYGYAPQRLYNMALETFLCVRSWWISLSL